MDEERTELEMQESENTSAETTEVIQEETFTIGDIAEPLRFEVSTAVDKNDLKELADAGYNNAKDTMKADSRIDPVVGVCGFFAVACLCVSTYNAVKNGFDALVITLMVCYVLVAVFCLCKPLQRLVGRLFYGLGFAKKLKLNAAGKKAAFDALSVAFEENGEERILYYDAMWTGYITDKYYVFHADDKTILPVSKENVLSAGDGKTAVEMQEFFENCIHKADKTAPEEEVPDITR